MIRDIKITEQLRLEITFQNYIVLTSCSRGVIWGTLSRALSNWFLSMSKMETTQPLCTSCYSGWLPSQQNSVLLCSDETLYKWIFAYCISSHHWHCWKETASIFIPSHQVFIHAKFPLSLLRLKRWEGSSPLTCFWLSLLQESIMGSASCLLGPRNNASWADHRPHSWSLCITEREEVIKSEA